MPDGLVRWPARPVTPGRVAVITVSYNTRELTALLLWSLRRRPATITSRTSLSSTVPPPGTMTC